eukprot:CAMPEP_0202728766 /NCGR_PEP_ID=MMETSP1385-20130828/185791_1 /ASSEMBLY_ACC=CAM_ASM_000861 /TAXON_ID=933848 /ORGANISM="Elphidium margaritaceum" /LENGTH=682 /DNA_ID=CAMNT_0049395017 /DNA_START=2263 /DNA_END=4313 /DNA_ORIENTATION=-
MDEFAGYSCAELVTDDIIRDESLEYCQSVCVSERTDCVQVTWLNITSRNSQRCYLFSQSCASLVHDPINIAITSFVHENVSTEVECLNYPLGWQDTLRDECVAYDRYEWCRYAYNSSVTQILSYADDMYGFSAVDACCDCHGGLHLYKNDLLLETVWKPTALYPLDWDTDFVCQSMDVASSVITDGYLDDNIDLKMDLAEFIGLVEYLLADALHQNDLLLSIRTDDNVLRQKWRILEDFAQFEDMQLVDVLYLSQVTICEDTDMNNLFPFIVDIENRHLYVNEHYIRSDTFVVGLPSEHLSVQSFCAFESLLDAAFETPQPTAYPSVEPTTDPTTEPTTSPSQEPTTVPTTSPSEEPTVEPTNAPTVSPTQSPTSEPTTEPTASPSDEPTVEPSDSPTKSPSLDTLAPTRAPTVEPTIARRRRALLQERTGTNVIATVVCSTVGTLKPSMSPTLYPTDAEELDLSTTMLEFASTLAEDEDSSTSTTLSTTEADIEDGDGKEADESARTLNVIVGMVMSTICMFAIGFFLYLRKRRRDQQAQPDNNNNNNNVDQAQPAPPIPAGNAGQAGVYPNVDRAVQMAANPITSKVAYGSTQGSEFPTQHVNSLPSAPLPDIGDVELALEERQKSEEENTCVVCLDKRKDGMPNCGHFATAWTVWSDWIFARFVESPSLQETKFIHEEV